MNKKYMNKWKMVGAQLMPCLLDVNLCKNEQTTTYNTFWIRMDHYLYIISLYKVLFIVCFCCLFVHKLASNKPGICWAVTSSCLSECTIVYGFSDNQEYNISGLTTHMPRAFLNRTALKQTLTSNTNAFHYVVSSFFSQK